MKKLVTTDLYKVNNAYLIEKTVKIVSAYVSWNVITSAELPIAIAGVHEALINVAHLNNSKIDMIDTPTLLEIKSSFRHDRLKSFIDGKLYKSLKRHLTANGFTPEKYRARYGLPADYPMVAPAYAAVRSQIAMRTYYGDKAA